jgi:ABC-type Mn2+/Zn2+ transport system permease subunit
MDGEVMEGTFGAHGLQTSEGSSSFPLYVIYIVMALLTAAGILLYKDRKKQLMLTRLNLIFHILIAFSFSVFYYLGKTMVEEELTAKGFDKVAFSMEIGFFLLVATIPFLILAIRGIKHDENLLKSIDRIR